MSTIYGIAQACEGAKVYCPACDSVGQIAVVGTRWDDTIMGKQTAFSDDICVCKCTPSPRLIESQRTDYQQLEGHRGAERSNRKAAMSATAAYDEQFTLRDDATRAPLANVRYRVRTASGQVFKGVTDSNGQTRRINTTNAEVLHIEVENA